jgi:hypothetical protein
MTEKILASESIVYNGHCSSESRSFNERYDNPGV